MKKYTFRHGSIYNKSEATIVGRYIEQMFPNEDPTPEEVVNLARPKNSPIHKYFQWDDSVAAERIVRSRIGRSRSARNWVERMLPEDNGRRREQTPLEDALGTQAISWDWNGRNG